jgi:hypothetical protein
MSRETHYWNVNECKRTLISEISFKKVFKTATGLWEVAELGNSNFSKIINKLLCILGRGLEYRNDKS